MEGFRSRSPGAAQASKNRRFLGVGGSRKTSQTGRVRSLRLFESFQAARGRRDSQDSTISSRSALEDSWPSGYSVGLAGHQSEQILNQTKLLLPSANPSAKRRGVSLTLRQASTRLWTLMQSSLGHEWCVFRMCKIVWGHTLSFTPSGELNRPILGRFPK